MAFWDNWPIVGKKKQPDGSVVAPTQQEGALNSTQVFPAAQESPVTAPIQVEGQTQPAEIIEATGAEAAAPLGTNPEMSSTVPGMLGRPEAVAGASFAPKVETNAPLANSDVTGEAILQSPQKVQSPPSAPGEAKA